MPYKANLTKRHHFKKHTYRQSNYSDYNNALKNRGFVSREDDPEMYRDTYEEAQRIIRISDEIRISLQKIDKQTFENDTLQVDSISGDNSSVKITSSKLASKLKLKTPELLEMLISLGYIEENDAIQTLTNKGLSVGGEACKGRFGAYFMWPEDFKMETILS